MPRVREGRRTQSSEVPQRVAVASPLDVRRLAAELDLVPLSGRPVPAGHGGHSVTELVVALAGLVDHLDLITLDPELSDPIELRGPGVRLAVGPFRPQARTRSRDLFSLERSFVAERIRAWQPDVVSAHWTYEYALGSLQSGRPTLTTVRDWAPTILWHQRDPYRVVRLLMQLMTFARGRNFAAVSPYMADRVQRFTRRPCGVLPNALGGQWFTGDSPALAGHRVLAANAGFGRRKNVQRLLVAWPAVLKALPDAELTLAGDGYETGGPAHRWAQRRGLLTGVRFVGPVNRSELRTLMGDCSVFAHPSLEESFGMVVLEAMAVGVPVLGGHRSGAVPWLLAEGAGLVVDVRRPSTIAEGLLRLLTDIPFARLTALRGHERASERFDVNQVARSYVETLAALATQAQGVKVHDQRRWRRQVR